MSADERRKHLAQLFEQLLSWHSNIETNAYPPRPLASVLAERFDLGGPDYVARVRQAGGPQPWAKQCMAAANAEGLLDGYPIEEVYAELAALERAAVRALYRS